MASLYQEDIQYAGFKRTLVAQLSCEYVETVTKAGTIQEPTFCLLRILCYYCIRDEENDEENGDGDSD